jgi:tRNA-Thr(GGU) m(6)t(6)A37 methyltransferase TsaA
MPIQPAGACGVRGTVEVFPEFCGGLDDLGGFSRIILVYFFHRSHGYALRVVPFLDDRERGVFATRAPRRPNPIGLSVVRLVAVQGCRLVIEDVDVLDGTPVLDIKPYVPSIDAIPASARAGSGSATGTCARPGLIDGSRGPKVDPGIRSAVQGQHGVCWKPGRRT